MAKINTKIRQAPEGSRYKYLVNFFFERKRKRRYFYTLKEAETFVKEYERAIGCGDLFTLTLSQAQIEDVKTALKILPEGETLSGIVRKFIDLSPRKIPIKEAFEAYKNQLKELNGGILPKIRITPFFDDFESWGKAHRNKILDWLNKRGAPKTIKEYTSELKRFYNFCVRCEYIAESPFDNISYLDLPKVKRKKPDVWTVDDVKLFFDFLEECYPNRASWFAIACFAGIRRAEINRLTPECFDLENKRITLPFDIVKTGDSWLMDNLPDNLWAWLSKYGIKSPKLYSNFFDDLLENFSKYYSEKTGGKTFEWKHNICRHSFCTYHLSLYREPQKTSMLLKHRSPQTMWQHYIAGLVSKEIANKYFSILPKK